MKMSLRHILYTSNRLLFLWNRIRWIWHTEKMTHFAICDCVIAISLNFCVKELSIWREIDLLAHIITASCLLYMWANELCWPEKSFNHVFIVSSYCTLIIVECAGVAICPKCFGPLEANSIEWFINPINCVTSAKPCRAKKYHEIALIRCGLFRLEPLIVCVCDTKSVPNHLSLWITFW